MRYVTLRIEGEGDDFHTDRQDAFPASVGRGPVYRIELLADGSTVMLRSVSGDLAAYRDMLVEQDAVHSLAVTGSEDGHVFVHYEPSDAVRELLQWRRQVPVIVQTPIEFDEGHPVVTLVGDVEDFTVATASLPDSVTFNVLETGQFSPQRSRPFHGLTDRQQEILGTALELGYYENPRGATQADIARRLSLSPGTVGAHLRKIEAHVFSQYPEPPEW